MGLLDLVGQLSKNLFLISYSLPRLPILVGSLDQFDILIDLVLTIDEKKIFTILEITNLDWAKFLENSKQWILNWCVIFMEVSAPFKLSNVLSKFQDRVDVFRENFSLQSFHCSAPRKMALSKMDPSSCVGFLLTSRWQFDAWCEMTKDLVLPSSGSQVPMLIKLFCHI